MTAYVFLGPSLSVDEARDVLDAVYLPPVRQGDVYRVAVQEDARAIGIVDGYFDQVPSVWHKEILWALANGIAVYGSASMGALRAAELAPFGMIGVGRTFDAYLAGELEDDDEVAVVHGPPELGYRPLSEAMVSIRATLSRAASMGVIGDEARQTLEAAGKALFYRDRSYAALLSRGEAMGVPRRDCEALRAWLPRGAVDQKRDDALAMLAAMGRALTEDGEAASTAPVAFTFENTVMWARASAAMLAEDDPHAAALAELRLQGAPYREARRSALARLLAEPVDPPGHDADAAACRDDGSAMADRERAAQQIIVDARRRGLSALAASVPERLVARHIVADLRTSGALTGLARRAAAKARLLEALEAPDGRPIEVPTPAALLVWYFGRLRREVPGDLDGYARRHGFADAVALHRALAEEYVFVGRSNLEE